jgi:thiamine biosynthesis lipoprotein
MSKGLSASTWRPSRREMLFIGVGGFIAAVPFARRTPLTLVRRNVLTMGTIAEFAVAHRDPLLANAAIDKAVEELRFVDTMMSRFKPSSDIGRANVHAAHSPVTVCAETMDVLQEALRWAGDTGGIFDPCLGQAIVLWDVGGRQQPPDDADVSRLARRQLYRKLDVSLHHGSQAVRFDDPDVRLDLGAIAKGYAVDRAIAALRGQGVRQALVGAGGDIYALGRSPADEPWQVGIQSPDDDRKTAGVLKLEDQAVATSGDYRQFFVHHGHRYHHLLDPETGAPRDTRTRSVSVVADTCMAADAGATVAFVAEHADAVLRRHGAQIAHRL